MSSPHDDMTVVVFRGTDFGETSDWLANSDAEFERTEHGGIHAGFYQAYLSLQPQIEKLLAAGSQSTYGSRAIAWEAHWPSCARMTS
jgi:hypothetical protein